LLKIHAGHEERDIFAKVRVHDPDVVDLVMKEHAELARRIESVAKTCKTMMSLRDPGSRIELGDRFIQEVNDLLAFYLSHMNNEETLLVPVMWEWFSDEEIRAMRMNFYDKIPLPQFEAWMRWTLPAMNSEELIVLFSGLKTSPESPRIKDWIRLAHETLGLDRWVALREGVRVDLPWESRPPG
jgi:hypothetical protein